MIRLNLLNLYLSVKPQCLKIIRVSQVRDLHGLPKLNRPPILSEYERIRVLRYKTSRSPDVCCFHRTTSRNLSSTIHPENLFWARMVINGGFVLRAGGSNYAISGRCD
jgi:hypothetical protein